MKKILTLIAVILVSAACAAQTREQADSLKELSLKHGIAGETAEARSYALKAMDAYKKLFGEVSPEYISSLNLYALSFSLEENYKEATVWQEKAMALCEKLPEPHPDLAQLAMNMAGDYYFSGRKQEAISYWEMALPLVEKHSERYEQLLKALDYVYDELGDKKALARILALSKEHNDHELSKPCDEPKCLLERAQYFALSGETAKAREHFVKATGMEMDNETKVKVHQLYAMFLMRSNDYVTAAENMLKAAAAQKAVDGISERYANLAYSAANYCFIAKDYRQAISGFETAAAFYRDKQGPEARSNEAKCLKGLGNAYRGLNDNGKAVELFRQLVAYHEQYDTQSDDYPKDIMRLATAEKFASDYASSIEHHLLAMQIFEQRGLAEDYSDALSSLMSCYAYSGKPLDESIVAASEKMEQLAEKTRIAKLDEIISEEKANLELTREYLGSFAYSRSLAVIAGSYALKGDEEQAAEYYKQYLASVREPLIDRFMMLDEHDRKNLWETERTTFSEIMEMLVDHPIQDQQLQQELTANVYDALLFSKGILLQFSILFSDYAQNQGSDSKEKAEKAQQIRAELENLRKEAHTDDDLNRILQLSRQLVDLHLSMYGNISHYADIYNTFRYNWKDVKNCLRKKDVAVEFAMIDNGPLASDKHLVALVLTKDMTAPEAIAICDMQLLKAVESDPMIFENNDAANVIWLPLQTYLEGRERLFFSADGVLNRIAIEYLPYKGRPLSDQYEVYRLSSTRELCLKHDKAKPRNAVLFGDINYNMDATTSENSSRTIAEWRSAGNSTLLADLKNTLREVDGIKAILQQNGVSNTIRLRDTEASREAFLNLSETNVNILHIATHGVYIEKSKASDTESMQNSLLAFAGANLDDEGTVTAADVAKMNLRKCDLAVLSACETGLGKLGNDGVFGLQRGFKNAGVHSLLMSLKQVNDQSTAELMLSFYNNLMMGKSKRKALIDAQRELRSKGFDSPQYWATFILLDALD